MRIEREASNDGEVVWFVGPADTTGRCGVESGADGRSRRVVAGLMDLASQLGRPSGGSCCLGEAEAKPQTVAARVGTKASLDLLERALLVELDLAAGLVEPVSRVRLAQLFDETQRGDVPEFRSWEGARIVGALLSSLWELATSSTPSLARIPHLVVANGVLEMELRGSPVLLLLEDSQFGDLGRIAAGRTNAGIVIRAHTVHRCLQILGGTLEYHRNRDSAAGVTLRLPVEVVAAGIPGADCA